MKLELMLVALGCFVLALGHTAVGRSVLPDLAKAGLAGTPFGPPSLTLSMVRFTWHMVSIVVAGFGILFLALAWAPDADPKTLLLRWFAALWLVAAAVACWSSRRRLRSLLRFPVPLGFVFVAVMSWIAST